VDEGQAVKRGEVWWADFPRPIGRRPVVLLSRDAAYRVRTAVTVAPVTRTVRDIPVEVPLDRVDGLPAPCVVNLDDITTIPKTLVTGRISTLSGDRMREIAEAIRFALDLP
jgi:mRNA interferase MazF